MPNSYANLGSTIGDIFSRAAGTRTSGPAGYQAGVNAGSQHMLRSAQTGQAMADTDKIMYELAQARKGDNTTAQQLAAALGVDEGAYDALSVPGATTMPAIPGAQGPAQPVAIPQAMKAKFDNANTVKIMSQLMGGTSAGGTVDTGMAALLKGQDLGMMSDMQGGQQMPFDVATMKAAMGGKLPGRTGAGGGSTAAKVQEMNSLTAKYKAQGMKSEEAHDAALLSVYGDPENEAWTKAFTRAYQSTFSVSSAIKAADASVARRNAKSGKIVPVKIYK